MSQSIAAKEARQNLNRFQKFFFEYGCYHNDTLNVWIHITCVPLIVLTISRLFESLSFDILGLNTNIWWFFLSIVSAVYLYVDLFSGILTSAFYWIASYFLLTKDFTLFGLSGLKTAALIHVIAWLIQFVGHGFFEKRKPALMDNIFLTINAPLFVTIELLYFFVGFRKNQIDETKTYIVRDIVEFRKEKAKKN